MRRLVFFFACALLQNCLSAQTFWKRYSPTYFFYNASVATPDNGLVMVSNSTDSNYLAPRLLRIDSTGNILWSQQMDFIPDSNRGSFVELVSTHDSCFVAAGTLFTGPNFGGILLHKFDLNGSTIWTKMYIPDSCNGNLHGLYSTYGLIRANDNGFAVSGSGGSLSTNAMFLLKTDSTGNPEWFKAYTDDSDFRFHWKNLCQDNDSGFVLFNQYDWLGQDGLLVHTDRFGNLVWSATLDSMNSVYLKALHNIDGRVYLAFENGFVKSELDTNPVWVKRYLPVWNGEIDFTSLSRCVSTDLAATFITTDGGGVQFGTLRTDSSGNIKSINKFDVLSRPYQMTQLPDSRFLYQGTGYMGNTSFVDVVMLDSMCRIGCYYNPVTAGTDSILEKLTYAPVNEIECAVNVYSHVIHWRDTATSMDYCQSAGMEDERPLSISIFPNPSSGHIEIKYIHPPQKVEVYTMNGQVLMSIDPDSPTTALDLSSYAPGLYLIKVIVSEAVYTVKLLFQ